MDWMVALAFAGGAVAALGYVQSAKWLRKKKVVVVRLPRSCTALFLRAYRLPHADARCADLFWFAGRETEQHCACVPYPPPGREPPFD